MVALRRTDDVALMVKLHSKLFPEDYWPGDDHTFWVATDDSGLPVGFCSAVYRPDLGYVFLSRAGVDKSVRGAGLQRRMIRTRLAWAKKTGAREVITYTLFSNHASIVNLIKSGFKFYVPDEPYVGMNVHYFRYEL